MNIFTIKEYAQKHGVSRSTARNRLEKMVYEGKATMNVRWEEPEYKSWSPDYLPTHRVNYYTIS
jgi:response regulator of citrate/malate metabolism